MSKEPAFMRICRLANEPCWICNEPIQYGLPRNDNWRFTKDHYMPISTHPHLEHIVENWRAAHAMCNSRRGNRQPDETVWIGRKEDGFWLRPQRPPKLVSKKQYREGKRKERKKLKRRKLTEEDWVERREAGCVCGIKKSGICPVHPPRPKPGCTCNEPGSQRCEVHPANPDCHCMDQEDCLIHPGSGKRKKPIVDPEAKVVRIDTYGQRGESKYPSNWTGSYLGIGPYPERSVL